MKRGVFRIVPMQRGHITACAAIVAASEPWNTLGVGVDFTRARSLYEAHVCTVGGGVAGFAIFTPLPVFARGGYLRALGVAPAMRRKGVGRLLMSFLERRTALLSPNLYLCVSSFNRRAQRFYRRLGYTKVGKIPGLLIPNASEYIFWKKLKRPSKRTAFP